jgi:hypothetical protein
MTATQSNKMTKTQKFEQLRNSELQGFEKSIVRECSTYKELKENLAWYANKFHSIAQVVQHCKVQYYLGETNFYSPSEVQNILNATYNIASELGLEIYSPNGAWFVRSIK